MPTPNSTVFGNQYPKIRVLITRIQKSDTEAAARRACFIGCGIRKVCTSRDRAPGAEARYLSHLPRRRVEAEQSQHQVDIDILSNLKSSMGLGDLNSRTSPVNIACWLLCSLMLAAERS